MKSRFFWKIALLQIVVFLLSFLFLGLFFSHSILNQYKERLFNDLRTNASLLAQDIHDYQILTNSVRANEFVREKAAAIDSRVTIIDPAGIVIAESESNPDLLENHADRPEFIEAMNGEVSVVTRFSDTFLMEYVYTAAPVFNDDRTQVQAVLRIAKPLSSIAADQARMTTGIIGATAVAAGIIILLDIFLLHALVKPIQKITRKIQTDPRIGAFQTEEKKNDEITTLEKAFSRYDLLISSKLMELEAGKTELETIINTMTDGLIICDEGGSIKLTNHAVGVLFPHLSSAATHLINVVRDDQIVHLWETCKKSDTEVSDLIELSAVNKTIHVTILPLKNNKNHDYLFMIKDTSELKKLHNLRQEFISNVSHELRTPIASIKALSETINSIPSRDHKTRHRFVTLLESEIDNISQLVEELLELARIESAQVPFLFRSADPIDLIREAYKRMKYQAERAHIEIRFKKANLPQVICDAQRIQTVLVNLLHNAIKFTPPAGHIDISARKDREFVVFSVIDSGIGINEDDLDRIFERFFKIEPSRASSGTGLGLSISKHIIEAHHGKIWAESDGVHGSSFHFSLPISDSNP